MKAPATFNSPLFTTKLGPSIDRNVVSLSQILDPEVVQFTLPQSQFLSQETAEQALSLMGERKEGISPSIFDKAKILKLTDLQDKGSEDLSDAADSSDIEFKAPVVLLSAVKESDERKLRVVEEIFTLMFSKVMQGPFRPNITMRELDDVEDSNGSANPYTQTTYDYLVLAWKIINAILPSANMPHDLIDNHELIRMFRFTESEGSKEEYFDAIYDFEEFLQEKLFKIFWENFKFPKITEKLLKKYGVSIDEAYEYYNGAKLFSDSLKRDTRSDVYPSDGMEKFLDAMTGRLLNHLRGFHNAELSFLRQKMDELFKEIAKAESLDFEVLFEKVFSRRLRNYAVKNGDNTLTIDLISDMEMNDFYIRRRFFSELLGSKLSPQDFLMTFVSEGLNVELNFHEFDNREYTLDINWKGLNGHQFEDQNCSMRIVFNKKKSGKIELSDMEVYREFKMTDAFFQKIILAVFDFLETCTKIEEMEFSVGDGYFFLESEREAFAFRNLQYPFIEDAKEAVLEKMEWIVEEYDIEFLGDLSQIESPYDLSHMQAKVKNPKSFKEDLRMILTDSNRLPLFSEEELDLIVEYPGIFVLTRLEYSFATGNQFTVEI